ncbi:hypothetical protein ANRL3_01904 [Anaerolineae bacterium]|nr:hypothetical protein ANRL3_01904 [Anaerolineae bacterium]
MDIVSHEFSAKWVLPRDEPTTSANIDAEMHSFASAIDFARRELIRMGHQPNVPTFCRQIRKQYQLNRQYAEDALWFASLVHNTYNYQLPNAFILSRARYSPPVGNSNIRVFYDASVEKIFMRVVISHLASPTARSPHMVQGEFALSQGGMVEFLHHLVDTADLYDVSIEQKEGFGYMAKVVFLPLGSNSTIDKGLTLPYRQD